MTGKGTIKILKKKTNTKKQALFFSLESDVFIEYCVNVHSHCSPTMSETPNLSSCNLFVQWKIKKQKS